jgi:hypothetical protein
MGFLSLSNANNWQGKAKRSFNSNIQCTTLVLDPDLVSTKFIVIEIMEFASYKTSIINMASLAQACPSLAVRALPSSMCATMCAPSLLCLPSS